MKKAKKKAKKVLKKKPSLTSHLVGRSKASIKSDKKRSAKSPGKRKSKSGENYYENRPNRSDIDKKIKI